VVRIGWPDQFIEHGKPDALRAKYGISVEAVLEKLRPYRLRTGGARTPQALKMERT